jgi:serine/threonine-protein kinase
VDKAIENYEQAAKLGPRQPRIFLNYGYLLHQTGQQDQSCAKLDHALALEPESIQFRLTRAVAEISRSGDTGRVAEILAGFPPKKDPDGQVTAALCNLAILKRDFRGALTILQTYKPDELPTIDSGGLGPQDSKLEAEGTVRLLLGDREGDRARARECFESVRWKYEDAVWHHPKTATVLAARALLYAWLGWKKEAIIEADGVLKLVPPAEGPEKRGLILALAKTYAWADDPDRAWRQIERFLDLPPSDYTLYNFRLDPVWDPIRDDPRFRKRIEKK